MHKTVDQNFDSYFAYFIQIYIEPYAICGFHSNINHGADIITFLCDENNANHFLDATPCFEEWSMFSFD